MQGYLFNKPMPANELVELLASRPWKSLCEVVEPKQDEHRALSKCDTICEDWTRNLPTKH
jgi:hypothetical protein